MYKGSKSQAATTASKSHLELESSPEVKAQMARSVVGPPNSQRTSTAGIERLMEKTRQGEKETLRSSFTRLQEAGEKPKKRFSPGGTPEKSPSRDPRRKVPNLLRSTSIAAAHKSLSPGARPKSYGGSRSGSAAATPRHQSRIATPTVQSPSPSPHPHINTSTSLYVREPLPRDVDDEESLPGSAMGSLAGDGRTAGISVGGLRAASEALIRDTTTPAPRPTVKIPSTGPLSNDTDFPFSSNPPAERITAVPRSFNIDAPIEEEELVHAGLGFTSPQKTRARSVEHLLHGDLPRRPVSPPRRPLWVTMAHYNMSHHHTGRDALRKSEHTPSGSEYPEAMYFSQLKTLRPGESQMVVEHTSTAARHFDTLLPAYLTQASWTSPFPEWAKERVETFAAEPTAMYNRAAPQPQTAVRIAPFVGRSGVPTREQKENVYHPGTGSGTLESLERDMQRSRSKRDASQMSASTKTGMVKDYIDDRMRVYGGATEHQGQPASVYPERLTAPSRPLTLQRLGISRGNLGN